MSSYRNLTPWVKGTNSSTPTNKSLPTKYDNSGVSRSSGISARGKSDDDKKSAFANQTPKYGLLNSAYQRTTTTRDAGNYTQRSELPRLKPMLEKKDTLHPPVSYRPIGKTAARSRDPSPIDRSEKSSSSSTSYNRLAAPNFRRSTSRERTNSTSSIGSVSSSLPKYSGRSSLSHEDGGTTRKYTTASREDLSGSKYITSRFLPKNTIERSYSGYPRSSSTLAKANETSRKNREFLNVIQAQDRGRSSRSVSRCSSINFDDIQQKSPRESETDILSVVTRGTSPTPARNSSLLKPKRAEISKLIQHQITRPKTKKDLTDKAIQSNDPPSKPSKTSSTPWNSILDMKFSGPNRKPTKTNSSNSSESSGNEQLNVSRNNSTKSICGHSCVPEDKLNNSKSTSGKSERKLLPPQIPQRDSSTKSLNLGGIAQNKDFRKSVLNMSDMTKKKVGRRSTSVSSADSESENHKDSEATDVSENLTSCRSYHNSEKQTKLPQKVASERNIRSRRSPSSDLSLSLSSANASGNEDELKKNQTVKERSEVTDNNRTQSFLAKALGPVKNAFKPRKDEEEKVKWILSSSSESKSVGEEKQQPVKPAGDTKFSSIHHISSGEIPWWLDDKSQPPEGVKVYENWKPEDADATNQPKRNESWSDKNLEQNSLDTTDRGLYKLRKNDSSRSCWWMDSNENSASNNSKKSADAVDGEYVLEKDEYGRVLYKIRRNDSGNKSWWNDSSENSNRPEETKPTLDSNYLDLHKIRHIDSGERSWWLSSQENLNESCRTEEETAPEPKYAIRHQDSGEPAWWLQNEDDQPPLGDRASPEGLEMPKDEGRLSPYDNVSGVYKARPNDLFISKHTNIDDILGGNGQMWSPLMEKIFHYQDEGAGNVVDDRSSSSFHLGEPSKPKLDDAALQLYKDGDYGSYLDLDASISEQQEEFEGFQANKKNSIVLRTQLSVRVHTIIEKLLTSEGRELRRALFSLKQIFQEDKDLVHEFVQNDGLSCLIKVGSEADQNYQNYILRALGQVMLYVDGMNGVMEHNQTIQWLYSLISSKFRLVVKTALKLLLVFVEYTDSNCMLLVKAIQTLDCSQGLLPWNNIMKLLKDFDSADTELLIYATTLINKVLNGVPDQDTYYDQTDALEEQGIEHIIQRYMSKPGTDLDLLQQFQIYEAVLQYEDGEETGSNPFRLLDENIRKTLRCRKSVVDSTERRKSRRHSTGNYTNALQQRITNGNILNRNSSRKDLTPLLNAVNKLDSEEGLTKQPWILSMMYNKKSDDKEIRDNETDNNANTNENERDLLIQLKRENTVKDLTQKLASQNILHSPSEENKINRIGDMSGLISKAKEGLAKSKSKADILKSPTNENVPKFETKKSENELRWEELVANLNRSLNLCDMDFTDLGSEDEVDILAPTQVTNGVPPPPPPLLKENGVAPPPPPLANRTPNPPPPVFNLQKPKTETKIPIKKNKKTVKLFWKEVRDDVAVSVKIKGGHIWDELSTVSVDTQKLEHLFESRAKDLLTKEKQQEMNKNKEIIVLDPKRSNAINIGMTKLPPPRSIKTAILKMDATIMNREGIGKLLTMLPTKDERTKIQEAQAANPDLPLGSAEQFLLTLASISELPARLKLWAFKLDFENTEKEIAEPLMDLKQGMEVLRVNKTFRGILSTLLSIGNFLNGAEVKGFQIEYLAKVPEVKDTVHKHSLLHHLCHIVMEKFPDATDLYSEIGAVTRASKVDFDELALNIQRLEEDCKASWDHLKLIAKHDGSTMIKGKMSDFLSDCAERIILLGIIHRRVLNRFHKFLLWLGIPLHQIADSKPNELCRIISEFALEYRTTRERVLQQLEKKANHRERNKTRGKMITDMGKFKTKEDRADAELRQLLGSDLSDVESFQGTLPLRRARRDVNRSFLGGTNGNLTDGDDEILESLVKTATKGPSRIAPRERKRTRHADRKSLKRSRTRENNPYGNQDSP